LKHAGEDNSATERREIAGMVTYERTSILHIESAPTPRAGEKDDWDALSELAS